MKTLREMDVSGKKVLVRADYNVPIENGEIIDDERIKATWPTIEYLLGQNCEITLVSHLGRPDGKVMPEFSNQLVAERLAAFLDRKLETASARYVGKKFIFVPKTANGGSRVSLLENIRFWPEEEKGDMNFARLLSGLGDIFVQEAFACCHRPHASISGVPEFLPSCAGFLLEKEVKALSSLLASPKRPFVVIIGGVKVSDKIGIIKNFLGKADTILIGGAMAYTFLKAQSQFAQTGDSKVEQENIEVAKAILADAVFANTEFLLPLDHLAFNPKTGRLIAAEEIPAEFQGVDIGEETLAFYQARIRRARTIFWNGPVGKFENLPFSRGTIVIARTIAETTQKGGGSVISVVGGGETALAAKRAGAAEQITHLSTGGGATLEFLAGLTLPGIAALEQSEKIWGESNESN